MSGYTGRQEFEIGLMVDELKPQEEDREWAERHNDHPQSGLEPMDIGSGYFCSECRQIICRRCGSAEGSWMSGLCSDCYLITERRQGVELRRATQESAIERLASAWDAGWDAAMGPQAARLNPYREALRRAGVR